MAAMAPGHGGAFTALALPAPRPRSESSCPCPRTRAWWRCARRPEAAGSLASGRRSASLVLAAVHPTYAIFLGFRSAASSPCGGHGGGGAAGRRPRARRAGRAGGRALLRRGCCPSCAAPHRSALTRPRRPAVVRPLRRAAARQRRPIFPCPRGVRPRRRGRRRCAAVDSPRRARVEAPLGRVCHRWLARRCSRSRWCPGCSRPSRTSCRCRSPAGSRASSRSASRSQVGWRCWRRSSARSPLRWRSSQGSSSSGSSPATSATRSTREGQPGQPGSPSQAPRCARLGLRWLRTPGVSGRRFGALSPADVSARPLRLVGVAARPDRPAHPRPRRCASSRRSRRVRSCTPTSSRATASLRRTRLHVQCAARPRCGHAQEPALRPSRAMATLQPDRRARDPPALRRDAGS